ncbi:hypothetical protein AMATHDRAFT_62125 [Amanita thiersii Skay4041]|uniref:PAS domain-containing protein n=1 Tax=Amanita thiersii Skay4041 TaxID=703135 RepID=A0A2A9NQG6_9AGAR|nr:hypothetical protein AMATHDRAFT_62125 [Amanita thiersii Skay4041]
MDPSPPCLSFIGIVDFSQEAKWIYMTPSVTDLLGYEPNELIGKPSLPLVHPDEYPRVKQLHYDTIQLDKAACLVYLRMRHKDPYKGYILCGISRTVVHNVLVGSVSFAQPGAKALQNASTATEITVLTPNATNFEFRRWNDPSPIALDPMPPSMNSPASPTPSSPTWVPSSPGSSRSDSQDRSPTPDRDPGHLNFDNLTFQSYRTAFILNRFSVNCTIEYCTNDFFLRTMDAIGRPFFDFVIKKDEDVVRSWIDCVKGWGVNERGQPSDGGFGFGKFTLIPKGRDSTERVPEPSPTRHRHGSNSISRARPTRAHVSRAERLVEQHRVDQSSRESPMPMLVDAIFSAHSDGLMVILRRATP